MGRNLNVETRSTGNQLVVGLTRTDTLTDRWGKHSGTKAAFDVTVSIVEPNSNSHSPNEVAALAT